MVHICASHGSPEAGTPMPHKQYSEDANGKKRKEGGSRATGEEEEGWGAH